MVEVDATYVAVAQHLKGFSSDVIIDEVGFDAFAFGDNVSGASACDSVGEYEYALFESGGGGEHEPGECVESNGHTAYPSGNHAQQSGFRSDAMHHGGAFAAEYANELPKRY